MLAPGVAVVAPGVAVLAPGVAVLAPGVAVPVAPGVTVPVCVRGAPLEPADPVDCAWAPKVSIPVAAPKAPMSIQRVIPVLRFMYSPKFPAIGFIVSLV